MMDELRDQTAQRVVKKFTLRGLALQVISITLLIEIIYT